MNRISPSPVEIEDQILAAGRLATMIRWLSAKGHPQGHMVKIEAHTLLALCLMADEGLKARSMKITVGCQ